VVKEPKEGDAVTHAAIRQITAEMAAQTFKHTSKMSKKRLAEIDAQTIRVTAHQVIDHRLRRVQYSNPAIYDPKFLGRNIYVGNNWESPPPKPKRDVSPGKRFDVLNRDKFRCAYCGLTAKETELHVDHIKAVSKGGSSEMDNLITACKDCNLGKHAKDINPEDLVS